MHLIPKKQPDNIIVIVADSLRFNTVFRDGSPGLPYIESTSTNFLQARSAGCWTLPATASMFSGLMPHQHGATSQTRFLNSKQPLLAELMKANGYNTVQVTANVATTKVFGLDKGFDEVHKIWKDVKPQFKLFTRLLVQASRPRFRKLLQTRDKIINKLSEDLQSGNCWLQNTYPDIFDKARQIISINEKKNKKSFLFLNLMESHFPYHAFPKLGFYSDTISDKLTEIKSLYHTINQSFLKKDKDYIGQKGRQIIKERQRKSWEILRGAIDEFVKELHQNKNNLVIFMADHGDNFGEQNWFYHFSNVTDAGNKIPFFWLDNNSGTARNIEFPVSSRFIFNELLRAINHNEHNITDNPSSGFSLFTETAENLPIMQSYWYNNMESTLSKYIYNQFAFMHNGMRYANRNGKWLAAAPASISEEPEFTTINGINPIEDCVDDTARKEYLKKVYKEYELFSEFILKKHK